MSVFCREKSIRSTSGLRPTQILSHFSCWFRNISQFFCARHNRRLAHGAHTHTRQDALPGGYPSRRGWIYLNLFIYLILIRRIYIGKSFNVHPCAQTMHTAARQPLKIVPQMNELIPCAIVRLVLFNMGDCRKINIVRIGRSVGQPGDVMILCLMRVSRSE